MKLAVVVPILNEERTIAATLRALRSGAPTARIIVIDGGSDDHSVKMAGPLCDSIVHSARGRGRQMNAGAALAADADALVFVHADTIVTAGFELAIKAALVQPKVVGGRFDVELDNRSIQYRVLETMINWRSRLMHTATGDQAIFVLREVFARLGGFAQIELCEDVDFMRRLRGEGTIACLHTRVLTSARQWQRNGFVRTILRMWTIKSLFLLGVSPGRLKRHYADTR